MFLNPLEHQMNVHIDKYLNPHRINPASTLFLLAFWDTHQIEAAWQPRGKWSICFNAISVAWRLFPVCVWFRGKEPLKDSVVSTYEEHEDSVYAAEWSSADPWLFASLSYDGRLVINRVPRALKYRILLWEHALPSLYAYQLTCWDQSAPLSQPPQLLQ